MSDVTALRVDENALRVPNLGDQGTALYGVVFAENSEQVLLHQAFNYVRIGRHRVIPSCEGLAFGAPSDGQT
jgi:hypothetical protein